MAYIHFESGYVPCGFLIVEDGADPHDESKTQLIQTDWDYPGVASRMGWNGELIDCETCRTDVETILNDAYDHIRKRNGESFPELDEYLNRD